jgi:hypothetical protein
LAAYKRPGRDFKLELCDRVLTLLIYYRSSISQEFLGYLFGIDDSRVCRLIKKIEPLLARTVAIRKDRQLWQEEGESLIIDATELPYKKPRNGKLDMEEIEYNTRLSGLRVKVESTLCKIKVFRTLIDRYRNKRKGYSLKFNIIAGIVNLKNGFANA